MPRKSTQGSSKGRRSSGRSTGRSSRSNANTSSESKVFDLRRFNNTDVQRVVKSVRNNPLALYIAGGVGALFLGRFAFRYYRNHPEIREFIRENIDMVEDTLRDYRSGGAGQEELSESRH